MHTFMVTRSTLTPNGTIDMKVMSKLHSASSPSCSLGNGCTAVRFWHVGILCWHIHTHSTDGVSYQGSPKRSETPAKKVRTCTTCADMNRMLEPSIPPMQASVALNSAACQQHTRIMHVHICKAGTKQERGAPWCQALGTETHGVCAPVA